MNELDIIKAQFEHIYSNRPSTIRSTLFYGPIGWIVRIIGWLFFTIGFGLIIATAMGSYLFSLPDLDKQISNSSEAYEQLVLLIQILISLAALIIGIILIVIGNLCRKIVNRNNYILELENLFQTQRDNNN